ncbi:hypothetical protein I2I11_20870 [Pontibacter sp. 172403-2]|uniref:hypothetical protein n=1 Tax=Pontibacter rufus TaxID=2791028 RepID=UPI0018AF6521|nr:hypothetical protein [Pontibacter sp. 172403-2]MBF9255764.1 hypothetical protein [Pontibacter sp. 172403-2]
MTENFTLASIHQHRELLQSLPFDEHVGLKPVKIQKNRSIMDALEKAERENAKALFSNLTVSRCGTRVPCKIYVEGLRQRSYSLYFVDGGFEMQHQESAATRAGKTSVYDFAVGAMMCGIPLKPSPYLVSLLHGITV